MKPFTLSFILLLMLFFPGSLRSQGTPTDQHEGFRIPTTAARQIIVVTTPDWDTMTGTVRTYERDIRTDPWREVHAPRAMTLGSAGLAWGRGLHGRGPNGERSKREGDKRSPAGIFTIDLLYGYAPETEVTRFSMPYLPLDSADECVDDPSSMYYNMIVNRKNVERVDWNSSERMRYAGKYYEWGIVVGHNADPRTAGAGSCIFLHVWGGSDEPTTGCTSLDVKALLDIMEWLSPSAHPMIVQLPENTYARYREQWKLP